ncbi:8661_t:CDS:2, partial [Funneliformis geosporum]
IPFMAIENEGSTERINETYRYVLRLYGHLINDQKALVTLKDIRVFFDILVSDEESPDECETKIRDILSGSVKSFSVEQIKAFPFCGYHTEKKSYLRIYTNGTGGRKTAIKAIQDNNFKTASDELYSFHHKQGKGTSPLCLHEFYVSIKYFCPLEDLTTISDRFSISALLRDCTLVLTWDIETQSQELGEFAEVLDLNNNVFMISMTLHWKDDLKPLKQICLVDVEIEPDLHWITIICGNQVNLLKAFALCWRAFAPDIYVGFNDSDYDWYFIMERAYHLNILEWMWERMTGKFETKEEILKTKINAEDYFTSSFLKLPVEKKGSLKFFLQKFGLDSKADMPYDKCEKSIQRRKKAPLRQPREICVKEVASIAYVSLFDTHYRANGMKVRNLLSACAIKRDM